VSVCADSPADAGVVPDALASGTRSSPASRTRQRSFRDFYDQHFDLVYGLVTRYGVRAGDAEDLSQQVFLVVNARSAELGRLENETAWLRAITVRVVHGYYRWRRVRKLHAWLVADTYKAADERTPERVALSHEAAAEVQGVLERMSAKLRDALVLVELEEQTPREAAAILGVPLNTLRSRLLLARRQFEQLFARAAARKGRREDRR
jgi:RNA polymerase sigma-70 factor (ECF subfamily)